MHKDLLLNPQLFRIDQVIKDEEKNIIYCQKLIDKWTPQLETEMLEAFIKLYYNDMYKNWGPDDEEESKKYWPQFSSPTDFIEYVGTDVSLYALEDAIYAKSKGGKTPYESQNVPVCVILVLNCPWDDDHGWAAVFVDENFVKVDCDIVDCVWLD